MERACKPNGPFCPTLQERLEHDSHKKGLVSIGITNLKTKEVTRTLIVHKSHPSDDGLALNLCPWCGGTLLDEWNNRKPNE
jgi:hypothetical protein